MQHTKFQPEIFLNQDNILKCVHKCEIIESTRAGRGGLARAEGARGGRAGTGGGGRHGQGILINERTNFKFSRTVTFDFPSPRHLGSCFLFLL
jgi:hypothetical protein